MGNYTPDADPSDDKGFDYNPLEHPYITGGLMAAPLLGAAAEPVIGLCATNSIRSLAANPFKGKTARGIGKMLRKKGYKSYGRNPDAGVGSYVNPRSGRGYHIDANHKPPKGPHVGVHRLRGNRNRFDTRDYPLE